VSWSIISRDELDRMIPVRPPIVNKKRNPVVHSIGEFIGAGEPFIVAIHLKILIPVGIAITMVADVK